MKVCAVCGRKIRLSEDGPFGRIWLHVGGWDPRTPPHAAKPAD